MIYGNIIWRNIATRRKGDPKFTSGSRELTTFMAVALSDDNNKRQYCDKQFQETFLLLKVFARGRLDNESPETWWSPVENPLSLMEGLDLGNFPEFLRKRFPSRCCTFAEVVLLFGWTSISVKISWVISWRTVSCIRCDCSKNLLRKKHPLC